MIEQRVPVIARWVVYALGSSEGRRVRRPIDPVAGWIIREHPALQPSIPQPALLSTIRARTELVDRMVTDDLAFAEARGEHLAYWSLGGGFDARWYRLAGHFQGVADSHVELEAADVVGFKSRLLEGSPFAERWAAIDVRTDDPGGWRVAPVAGRQPLVVIETGAGRLDEPTLRGVLARIRADAPDARVVAGLPTLTGPTGRLWTAHALRGLGWRFDEDLHVASRSRIMANTGAEMCPGMYPFRVARLVAV